MFGLINGLARAGKLTAEQESFRRTSNAWFEVHFPDPSETDPDVYDHDLNPGAVAWFKSSACVFIDRIQAYRDVLGAHGVNCDVLTTDDPGTIIYEDTYQVVAIPPPHSDVD